jgi:hypothetical protein
VIPSFVVAEFPRITARGTIETPMPRPPPARANSTAAIDPVERSVTVHPLG